MIAAGVDSRWDRLWWAVAAAVVAVALTFGIAAPLEAQQGIAQKLMYVHVPSALGAYLSFGVVFAASLVTLGRDSGSARALGRAAAEVGIALTALTLASGSLWGSTTWGTWWVWDARITSTVAMGLVYTVYWLADRLASSARGQRVVALWGVAAILVAPIVHFSVLWWPTLHQGPTTLQVQVEAPIDAPLAAALACSVAAGLVITAHTIRLRVGRLFSRSESTEAATIPVGSSA